jgi:hypothetical protein
MSNAKTNGHSFLKFRLEIDDDGWPPVGSESIPVIEREDGQYEVAVPPFFLKDISVGDQITVDLDDENYVTGWTHQSRSGRSTIWLLKGDAADLEPHLESLKNLNCNVERFTQVTLCSIDVPESVSVSEIDAIMARIKADGGQIAYPSFRH